MAPREWGNGVAGAEWRVCQLVPAAAGGTVGADGQGLGGDGGGGNSEVLPDEQRHVELNQSAVGAQDR